MVKVGKGDGEWITVIDEDGSQRQVEVRSTMMPWHRPPLEGEAFDFAGMLAMMQSTAHLLEDDPNPGDV
jgi:hypothetical protein